MPDTVHAAPNPKSHIKTLMKIGYTLNSAIGDLVDNSITAGARNISIDSPPGLEAPFISIVDDGCGMDRRELTENMRIGCKDPDLPRGVGDLGRFGSGLKTASFSQARCLTVISKKKDHPVVAARWDIDHIEESNSWNLEVFNEVETLSLEGLSERILDSSGTQIILSKLTCLEKGNHARAHDAELAERNADLIRYVELHFHRFMEGSGKINFFLNNYKLERVDPFLSDQPGYQEGPDESIRCKGGKIEIRSHVLPLIKGIKREKLDQLGGSEGIHKNQGLYIYREKRLIIAGGWLGMNPSNQLNALARIQVDIPSTLDAEWATDVKKASLQIPPRVKKQLRRFLQDPIRRSKRVYRYRGKLDVANKYWKVCEDQNTDTITYQLDTENSRLRNLLERCEPDARRMLITYLRDLARGLPINHIYEKMSASPADIDQRNVELKELEEFLCTLKGSTHE